MMNNLTAIKLFRSRFVSIGDFLLFFAAAAAVRFHLVRFACSGTAAAID
jgi:hypothetical protein